MLQRYCGLLAFLTDLSLRSKISIFVMFMQENGFSGVMRTFEL